MASLVESFDSAVFALFNFLRFPALTAVLSVITHLADSGAMWILLAVLLLIFKKTRRGGAAVALALIIDVVVVNLLLKNIVARPRPFAAMDFEPLISPPSGWSFPSGHSAVSFSAAVALCFHWRKWGIAALVLAFFIAASRVYLLVHYPTDVVAGIIIGTVCGVSGAVLSGKFKLKFLNNA